MILMRDTFGVIKCTLEHLKLLWALKSIIASNVAQATRLEIKAFT